MKAKILIVEDVKELSALVAMYLEKEGMETFQAETAEIALEKMSKWTPDLVILDLNLPGMDGFEFLNHFRKTNSIPVIIVSARDADEDIIAGLGYGADEFVTKPFSPKVLVARVRALIRRMHENSTTVQDDKIVEFGNFILDMNSFVLKRITDTNTERIPLSAKEYAVLVYLVENEGKILSPEKIYDDVWKAEFGDLSAVAVYIQRLRRKIELNPSEPHFIRTIYGMGYCFSLSGKEI
ncbi:MAG: response regulator transcription factor [Spirochaetaceae bacterium]|nr:response regulator transcription factor [Spirochaetaceae bacterium]MBP5328921.1 response regulator transcription factor [Spirochaetaceae bacterium]